MKKYFTLLFLLVSCYYYASAQCVVSFYYDPSGNRTLRFTTGCRPAPAEDIAANQQQAETITKYGITVYPNPASEYINISFTNLSTNDKASLVFYDMQGKELVVQNISSSQEQIFLTGLPAGDYFLKLLINEEKVLYKIQKME